MSIYVDLDGTLAEYGGYQAGQIGKPVPVMMGRVQRWLAVGETVKIFTARAAIPAEVTIIKKWLEDNGLPELEVTNVKGFDASEFWDDRAIRVKMNAGTVV